MFKASVPHAREDAVLDILFIGLIVAIFAFGALILRACARM